MLAMRKFFALGLEHLKTSNDLHASVSRIDDIVDEAALGSDIRIGKPLGVVINEFSTTLFGIGRTLDRGRSSVELGGTEFLIFQTLSMLVK